MIRAAALLFLAGCAPRVVWIGGDAVRRVRAEVLSAGGSQWLRVHDTDGPRFDAIGSEGIVFSADGRRIAYPAVRDGRWVMLLDGQVLGPWDGVADPVFSDDGARFAFLAESASRWHAVVDKAPGPDFERIQAGTLQFSRNGAHVAYAAVSGRCAIVVVDGAASPCLDGVVALRVLDGGTVAMVVRDGARFRFRLGSELGPPYDVIGEWVVTEDGRRAAYAAGAGGLWSAVVDGVPTGAWDSVRHLRFGDGGRRVVWGAAEGPWAQVVVDGRPGPRFRAVSALLVAPRSPGFAYAAHDEAGAWVVTEAGPRGPFADVLDLALSPRGDGLAFVARTDGRVRVVHGDRETRFEVVVEGSLVVSDDGRHWAVLAGDPGSRRMWISIDGERARPATADDVFGEAAHRLRPWIAQELRDALGADASPSPRGSP